MRSWVLRRALAWAMKSAHLGDKLRRWWSWRRAIPSYHEMLAQDELLVEDGPMPGEGLITVAMPVFRVAEGHLRAAIASVAAQTWPDWELVAVDDASPDPHVARVLAEAAADPRNLVVKRPSNGGISRASNDAVAAARGEFVAFLDHDDTLHPRALELAARCLARHPDTDWLFTDEDRIDERGRHSQPLLKPGWSRHLLLAFNLVTHLRVVRRSMIERVGGHRAGYEGAQDYDLALRVLAAGGRFRHLPGPLYHWRAVRGSMARVAAAKPEANGRALAALAEHARGFPHGGAVRAEELVGTASLFRVRRAADSGTSVAVATTGRMSFELTRCGQHEASSLSVSDTSPGTLVAAVRRSGADVVIVPPATGLGADQVAELLALLQVPDTGAVCGRLVRGGRVASSGWVVTETGETRDPWAGLRLSDPGYLNLALLPGRRAVQPPCGWAAWREQLLAAWDAAEGVPDPWRLAVGWARLGLEVVATPEVSVAAEAAAISPPSGDPPDGLPRTRCAGLARLGLLP